MPAVREAAVETMLQGAAEACARRGAQLTELRRQVLRLILAAEQPVGAYALLDQLKAERAGAAPPTIYRALDFLLDQGLIHRVERLNAFIGCVGTGHDHAAAPPGEAHAHAHQHQFLICRLCGATVELADAGVAAALARAAAASGFRMERATVEVEGRCARCAAEAASAAGPAPS
jgi:Fur family zinc uptake transcriptional regulator